MTSAVRKLMEIKLLKASFAIFCCLINVPQVKPTEDKLKVLVLYESLCPDSIRFMRHQLATSYNHVKDYIHITLVPFGKSQSHNNGAEFYCQHGPDECAGNRMQSCVLNQTVNQSTQVYFAVCQMIIQQDSIKYCAEAAGLSSDINACLNTEVGTRLQLKAEQTTKLYAPTFIPTVVYDGVFDQHLQDSSIRDFHSTVCRLLLMRGHIFFNTDDCQ